MNSQLFNNKMPAVNEEWASKILNMTLNTGGGVDLYDDNKVVEVKFHMPARPPKKKRIVCWRTQVHQLDYGKKAGLPF